MKKYTLLFSLILLSSFITIYSSDTTDRIVLELDTKKTGAIIQPTMYGLFFEDINFGADGGLYAELVKNRSFDFPQSLMGWNTFGNTEVLSENPPFNNNPNYVKLSTANHPHKQTGLENEGFRGIGFKKDSTYRFSVWAKRAVASQNEKIRIEFINSANNIIGSGNLTINSDDWKKYEVIITSKATEKNGLLRIFLTSKGSMYIDHVSLFPTNTWKGRTNGLRNDLAQALADIKPGVFRFPGGCIVEGTEIEDRYDWKKSIGPVENRPLNTNRWQYTFPKRLFPDYFQSYGMGFFEFFLLSEDMGAEPLPVVNCGLACQYQNKGEECHVSLNDLDSYIQDAIDLIEFANGDATTQWGKARAEMGHPEPFDLKYIGIGNEQWGEEYVTRLAKFVEAIRVKYPDIKIIGSSGPSADGAHFDYLWPEMKRLKVDLVDEHYYKEPDWFLNNAARYDSYDRKGPAVFAGEYASHDHPNKKANNMLSALSEAAFMTGLERNADIVHMCTYAPLFAHVDAWQWNPDMIWFDNLSLVKTPNYYVQQLYGKNAGTNVMSLTRDKNPVTGHDSIYASATYDKTENDYILKIVNMNTAAKDIIISVKGLKKGMQLSAGECTILNAATLKETNTIKQPNRIIPRQSEIRIDNNTISINIPKETFGVYRIKAAPGK